MSFRAMAWAVSVKTQTPTQKLILLLLADKANDDGFCWPKMSSIAEDACVTRQCVLENVKKLAALGYIQVEKRTIISEETGNPHNISHLYRVNVSKLPLVNEDDNPCKRGLQPLVNEDDNISYQYEPINETLCSKNSSTPKTDVEKLGVSVPPEHLELCRRLLDGVSAKVGRKLIAKPSGTYISKLVHKGVLFTDIERTVDWLISHSGEPYVPVVHSGNALIEKWDKIQSAMSRLTPEKVASVKPEANKNFTRSF